MNSTPEFLTPPAAPQTDVAIATPPLDAQLVETETLTGDTILRFFKHAHLPPSLQVVSAEFARLALVIASSIPRSPERTVALRKLLESKDCAVRAALS